MAKEKYNVIIIGGGVVGTSLLYALSNFTNIKKILLIEKYSKLGQVNSYRNNNSQTLHFGDIETNYNIEKAEKINKAAKLVKNYLEKYEKNNEKIYTKTSKIVLGIGKEQEILLKKRYKEFKKIYPDLKILNKSEISKLEPYITKERDENEQLTALYSKDGYAINYDALSESFVKHAIKSKIKINLSEKIKKIGGNYEIITDKDSYEAEIIVVCAGAHSLIFAKSLGYGKELGLLSIAGNFFSTKKKFLNGKAYTMQIEKLPFAAIHGDPYVDNPSETRFGPTAKVLLLLERYDYRTFFDFLKTSAWTIKGIKSLIAVISEPIILKYVLTNIFYDIPIIGKRFFIKEIRKIIPSIKLKELEYNKGHGGIRPQIIDINKKKLEMGDAKIYGKNIIFNITPSPGASNCLKNAEIDAEKIIDFYKNNLNKDYKFNKQKFEKELS